MYYFSNSYYIVGIKHVRGTRMTLVSSKGLFGCHGFLKLKYYKTIVSKASVKQNHGLEKRP
jgi:hypothetical protein